MKNIYLVFLIHFLSCNINAQDFIWSKVEGKYAYDYGYGIATDNYGNVYVTGKYEELAVFSGTTLPNQGNHDIYLAQYSASGNLNWIRTGGGYTGDYARILACDKTAHVYIAGEIEGINSTIIFPGSSITINGHGENDVFLASYDLNGNLLWARSEGSVYNEKALGITYDNLGNVIICGYFNDTTNFGGNIYTGNGGKDLFVAKYNSNGNLLWMQHTGGPGEEEAKSVTSDMEGNIYICGKYSDGAIFGNTTYSTVMTPYGQFFNGYIAKYSPEGTFVWMKNIDGDYDDIAWSITRDNNQKIYVTGEFSGANFDSHPLYTYGKSDVFVTCFDSEGSFEWAVHGGELLADRARGIGTDGSNIFITGQFGGTAVFGNHTISAIDSSDIFVAELDNTGQFLWAKSVGGIADAYEPDGYESGIAVCGDTSGVVYFTGSLLNGGVFGNTTLNGYTRTDIFISKISTIVSVEENLTTNHMLSVYPNPGTGLFNIAIEKEAGSDNEIRIYNYLGELVIQANKVTSAIQIDLSDQPKGIYFVHLNSNKNSFIEKIVLN